MLQYPFRTILLVLVFAGAIIGYCLTCFHKPVLVRQIVSRSDMADAMESENAIIFARCNWSASSALAQVVVSGFARKWHEEGNAPPVSFFLVDLSGAQQNAPPFIQDWLQADSRLSHLPFDGAGDVVWLSKGKFRKSMPAYDKSVDDLIEEARKVFVSQEEKPTTDTQRKF